jgi:hypothetical protein
MESNKISTAPDLTDDDFEDFTDGDSVYEMQLMMQCDPLDEVSDAPPVQLLRKQFDFCEECYTKFSADPLGLDRVSHRRFSAN